MFTKATFEALKLKKEVIKRELKSLDGEEACFAVMNGVKRDAYESFILPKRDKNDSIKDSKGLRSKLISLTLCDESGKLLFTPKNYTDIDELPVSVIDEMYAIAQEINKYGTGEEDLKNSEAELSE